MKIKDALTEVLDVDHGLVKTFLTLLYNPKKVLDNTAAYTSPLRFSLILTSIGCAILLFTVKIFSDSDDFTWAIPRRVFETRESYSNFNDSFKSAIFLIEIVPVFYLTLLIINLKWQKIRSQSLPISLYIISESVFIVTFFSAIAEIALSDTTSATMTTYTLFWMIPTFAYLLFSLSVIHEQKFKGVLKSVLIVSITFFLYSFVADPFFQFAYHRMVNGKHLIYHTTVTSDFKPQEISYEIEGPPPSALAMRNDTLEVFLDGAPYHSKIITTRGIMGGSLYEFQVKNYFLLANQVSVAFGEPVNNHLPVDIRLNDQHKNFQIEIRDQTTILYNGVTQDSAGTFIILSAGYQQSSTGTRPYLNIQKLLNHHGDLTMDRSARIDSVFPFPHHGFYKAIVTDSLISVMDYNSPAASTENVFNATLTVPSEVSKMTLRTFSYNNRFIEKWSNVIYEKETRYSPTFRAHLITGPGKDLYSIYTVPNDTNVCIFIHSLNIGSGKVNFFRKINPQNDEVFIQKAACDKDGLYLGGRIGNLFAGNPFQKSYTLATLMKLDIITGSTIKTINYGSTYNGAYSFFGDFSTTPDHLILSMRTDTFPFGFFDNVNRKLIIIDKKDL
ncbi:MAG: hypothetical protein HOP08_07170 [Cyclobacteriaceae bacterium]|nr:hypothetical protein [Cyclobacteriaceae bacterium]